MTTNLPGSERNDPRVSSDRQIYRTYRRDMGTVGTAVYLLLCDCADEETGETTISQGEIADLLDISRPTANKSIARLADLRLITVESRQNLQGFQISSLITILPRETVFAEQGVKNLYSGCKDSLHPINYVNTPVNDSVDSSVLQELKGVVAVADNQNEGSFSAPTVAEPFLDSDHDGRNDPITRFKTASEYAYAMTGERQYSRQEP